LLNIRLKENPRRFSTTHIFTPTQKISPNNIGRNSFLEKPVKSGKVYMFMFSKGLII
jgi:hypothetical protein